MTFTHEHAGRLITFKIRRRKRQKRVIIKPINNQDFLITSPINSSLNDLQNVVKKNIEKISVLQPPISMFDLAYTSKEIPIFGTFVDVSHHQTTPEMFRKYLTDYMYEAITELIDKYNPHFDAYDLRNIRFRTQYLKSIMGSCQYKTKRITINLELIHYPLRYLEYIFLHEIAHLKHPNHSETYYRTLKSLWPNHHCDRRSLKRLRTQLHSHGFAGLSS